LATKGVFERMLRADLFGQHHLSGARSHGRGKPAGMTQPGQGGAVCWHDYGLRRHLHKFRRRAIGALPLPHCRVRVRGQKHYRSPQNSAGAHEGFFADPICHVPPAARNGKGYGAKNVNGYRAENAGASRNLDPDPRTLGRNAGREIWRLHAGRSRAVLIRSVGQ